MASDAHALARRFVSARRATTEAVLEGHHALKHALRFGADVTEVVALDGTRPDELPPELDAVGLTPQTVAGVLFDRLVGRRPPVPVVARAARPDVDVAAMLAAGGAAPVVVLEDPTHAGNVGAAVRVAAAAGADGLVVAGELDPWSPAAIRGAAGLQYAVPVGRVGTLPASARPLVAFDPGGVDLRGVDAPDGAMLAFGTERRGLSDRLAERADLVVAIPMRPHVSSLNLATAVAVGLYAFTGPALDR